MYVDWTRLAVDMKFPVAVLGWGQGGTGPQILPRPPKFLVGSRAVLGYIGVRGYTPYTNLWCGVF